MYDKQAQTADILKILEALVAFDTTSFKSNLDLIDFVAAKLEKAGANVHVLKAKDQPKANMVATFGPNVPGGVVLSGHTDVVPVEGQEWTCPAFEMTEKDGKLFGRGTADMKGFLAVALAHADDFANASLKKPIHLAFSFDEEVGCTGIQEMLPFLSDYVAAPRLVVIGEPTSMQVATAHKGQYVAKTRIVGREAHSSRPDDGVNAVVVAAELIRYIDDMASHVRQAGPFDESFEPPHTTFNIGPISGGSAFNIISNKCEFDWEFRFLPDQDGPAIIAAYMDHIEQKVLPTIKAKFPECDITNEIWAYLPPLKADPGSDGESFAMSLAQKNESTVVAFGTEAGHFQGLSFPTVVCGPGDIAQAHKPDEFIEISDLEACSRFMVRVREAMCQ
ncbi:MAG: acetylornithine deacetylase [Kordiimonadaceae bacterium]|nr:acetylornithine deacetylase [Kordiimonadaceae bacterium]MBO6569831.1 acetylornithine deacetylase [Kordiimonadaceae bacterium]MBO6966073.1 acetylornithine deacetylase [Kordiimonadaceae bacterium]